MTGDRREYLIGLVRRVLVERAPQPDDLAQWEAIVDVLWNRAMSLLREEARAVESERTVSVTRAKFDTYVAALKDFEASVSHLASQPSAMAGGRTLVSRQRDGGRPCLRPELREPLRLLAMAESIWRYARPATVGFWNLLCDELAADLREAADPGQPSRSRSPSRGDRQLGRCTYCGVVNEEVEDAGMGICGECAKSALLRRIAIAHALRGTPHDISIRGVLEFLNAARTLAIAAVTLTATARAQDDGGPWVIEAEELRALRAALPEFFRAGEDVARHVLVIASDRDGGARKEAPRA
jgi:hypothetical protein